MNKITTIIGAIILASTILTSCSSNRESASESTENAFDSSSSSSNTEASTPIVDTTTYKAVNIGSKTWMAENLNVAKFRNGDSIMEAKTSEEWKKAEENQVPAWCYYDNKKANGEKYGRLYNYFAVRDSRSLAPEGYHIASDEEWTELTDGLGGSEHAGKKLKNSIEWKVNGNGSNESGFSGLPAGLRKGFHNFMDNDHKGEYSGIGSKGGWWTSSSVEFSNDEQWCRFLDSKNTSVTRETNFAEHLGLSVRCIKD